MTHGSLFAYNILTHPLTSGVRECKVVKLFYFNQMSELCIIAGETGILSLSKQITYIEQGGQNIIP